MSMITWLVAYIDKNSHFGFVFVMCLVYSERLRTTELFLLELYVLNCFLFFTKEFKIIPDKLKNDQVNPCPFIII